MAGGWSKDGAIQDQIDASVDDAVRAARARLTNGESLKSCEDCGEEIPQARREAIAGTDLAASTSSLALPVLGIGGSDDLASPPDLVRSTAALVSGSR